MKHTTIRGLVRTSEDARAGSNRSWQGNTVFTEDGLERIIYHYNTQMLSYVTEDDGYTWDGDIDTVDFSIGHGSVSDQNGMNKLFREAGIPAYFERAEPHGPCVVWLPRERHYA